MNKLAEAIAIHDNETFTEKGMAAHKSSTSACVDLFFKIGAMRGQDVIPAFRAAFNENEELAVRIALWARDVRGGAGERKIFRDILNYLEVTAPDIARQVIHMIPELGRWDDLLIFTTNSMKTTAYDFIGRGLRSGNALCAKWMPRKGSIAYDITKYFGISPKYWRQSLVQLTNVVEQKMCANQWDKIEFGKLPSLASKRYAKAFQRHVYDKYTEYLGRLNAGEDKVNVGAIYPHQIMEHIKNVHDEVLAQSMWDALPNYLGDDSIMPIIDTSGSMHSANVAHIAFALGMYLAEKGRGPFKDCFITFSSDSKIQKLTGSIIDRYHQVDTAHWDCSTNIAGAFDNLLDMARKNLVSQEDMPKILLILSDMQFDMCVDLGDNLNSFRFPQHNNPKALEMVKSKYARYGYKAPKIVFWNLADRGHNIPVTHREDGTALISGFSPSIMKSVLAAKNFTPANIMFETIMSERYNYKAQ